MTEENIEPFPQNPDEEKTPQEAEAAEDNAPATDMTRVQELESQLAEANDKMMRALAEAENTRQRARKDREDAGKFAVQSFAKDLLDFADNFRRALESLPEGTPEGVSGGLEAMQRELLSTFDRHGIQRLDPIDQPFDPNLHEVMFEAPMPDKAAGMIIQVIEPGFTLNGRLLRAAKVGIAKNDGQIPGENTEPGSQIDEQA